LITTTPGRTPTQSAHLPNRANGAIAAVNGDNFQGSYSGGDGNDLRLAIVH
jgi:hypothetical protein